MRKGNFNLGWVLQSEDLDGSEEVCVLCCLVSCPDIAGCSMLVGVSGDFCQEGGAYYVSKIHTNTSLESICY